MSKKQRVLVCYDYGMGGLWAIINADDAAEVAAKYPWLTVFNQRPPWMSDEEYNDIASSAAFDIDQPLSGWLLTAANEHRASPRP
jgi:hypothetical protein